MQDLAALPLEVLANVLANLPPCEVVQLQRVSQSFRRAAVADEVLEYVVVNRLLMVLSADGQSGRAVLAACAARRWLVRNAALVKHICSWTDAPASAWTGLVSCLPALEDVHLGLSRLLIPKDMGCLLQALAWCPRLRALNLGTDEESNDEAPLPFPAPGCAPTFAKLRGLTKLALDLGMIDPCCVLTDVVGALVSLTGLADLTLISDQNEVLVPAALGQLEGLRALKFNGLDYCVLEAGCLDLPNLQSLEFSCSYIIDADMLPGVTALQSLTCIQFTDGQGPRFFDSQLVQLPRLQRMVCQTYQPCHADGRPGLPRLPADMGSLCLSLLHLDFSGHGFTQFPLALTQLVALECLYADGNEFADVPAAITALSRLTELSLGRMMSLEDPLQLDEKRPLEVCALGDLSRFPALSKLSFEFCEVMLCESLLGAVRHASLASLTFCFAHPSPGCALVLLQLCQALRRLGRGRVLRFANKDGRYFDRLMQDAQGQAPFQKFKADRRRVGCEGIGCWACVRGRAGLCVLMCVCATKLCGAYIVVLWGRLLRL